MESGDFPPGSTSGSKVRVPSYWVIAVHCPQGQLLLLGSYPDTSQSGKTGDSGGSRVRVSAAEERNRV